MENNRKNLWISFGFAIFAFVAGIVFLLTSNYKNLTEKDVIEIQISFDRIRQNNAGDGDYRYIIYTTDDSRTYIVNNVVNRYFDYARFNTNVKRGDILTMKVYKTRYENNRNPITVFSVQKGTQTYLEFSQAFDKLKNNSKFTFIAGAILTPVSVSAITIVTVLLLIQKKKEKDNKKEM